MANLDRRLHTHVSDPEGDAIEAAAADDRSVSAWLRSAALAALPGNPDSIGKARSAAKAGEQVEVALNDRGLALVMQREAAQEKSVEPRFKDKK